MYELTDVDRRRIEQMQRHIPSLTVEKFQTYTNCMRTEAIVTCAIPVGLITAAAVYLKLPKYVTSQRKIMITGVAGVTGYIFGKFFYSPICMEKALGLKNERMKMPYTSDSVTVYNQEDHEKSYLMHPDKIEEEASWNNYDSGFQNYSSDFDDANDIQAPQEDKQLRNKQNETPKKRITYDDLWRQHKEEERNATYRDLMSLTVGRDRPAENERRKVPQESPLSEADDKI